MLAVGMFAWVVRYGLFTWGVPNDVTMAVLAGVVVHGICYDFFFVTGQIYTDQKAPVAIRGQAQGLLVLFTLGLGMFLGAKIAGAVETAATSPEAAALLEQAQPLQSEALQITIRLDDPDVADRAVLTARLAPDAACAARLESIRTRTDRLLPRDGKSSKRVW